MDRTNITTYKKKRKYCEIENIDNCRNLSKIFKPIFKYNNEYTSINYNISLIKIKSELENFIDYIGINLVSKILTKYNICYEKYITYAPGKKTHKKYSNNNNDEQKKELINNVLKTQINSRIQNKNNNNNEPEENKNNDINKNNYKQKYINEELYPTVRNFENIKPSDIIIINIIGDGNCLFRAISYFLNNTEDNHSEIRKQIYNEAIKRKPLIPNIEIETERGRVRIHDYISTIKEEKNYGGDLEISISYDLYNYNVAEYKEIYDNNGDLTALEFIQYINKDNNENKDLIILTNVNDNHFNLAYYKYKNINDNKNNSVISTIPVNMNNLCSIKINYEEDEKKKINILLKI